MFIKVGNTTVISMQAIERVTISDHTQVTKRGLFRKDEVVESLAIKILYTDKDGKDTHYTLYGLEQKDAVKYRDSILNQAKELDMERLSTELENAIRSNGDG
jgi:hypothetical protein